MSNSKHKLRYIIFYMMCCFLLFLVLPAWLWWQRGHTRGKETEKQTHPLAIWPEFNVNVKVLLFYCLCVHTCMHIHRQTIGRQLKVSIGLINFTPIVCSVFTSIRCISAFIAWMSPFTSESTTERVSFISSVFFCHSMICFLLATCTQQRNELFM